MIVGSGKQFKKMSDWFKINNPTNAKLLSGLSKENYDKLLAVCDVGLIFLNEKFTIPNYSSRLLDNLYYDLAILSNTDSITDIGVIIVKENIGKYFYGIQELDNMILEINKMKNSTYLKSFNNNSQIILSNFFNIESSYKLINNKITNNYEESRRIT